MNCYHVVWTVIMWDQMLSCGVECYHVRSMLSCGINVFMSVLMLSCGMKFYHVGWTVIMWDQMLSCGVECYHVGSMLSRGVNHVGSNFIMWGWMLSCRINVIMWGQMLSRGMKCYHVCYHVMLSWGMITSPPFYFSWKLHRLTSQDNNFSMSAANDSFLVLLDIITLEVILSVPISPNNL